ncbi:MAG: response regulator [Candidatus Omnitrophota bacterium]
MPDKKDFISIFKSESGDHLNKLDQGIVELERNPGSLELIKELNREAHTLKGSARVFGFYEIQEIAHKIEDIFDRLSQKKVVFNSQIADRIFKGLDTIRNILDKIIKEETINIDISDVCRELQEATSLVLESQKKEKEKPLVEKKEKPQTASEKKAELDKKKEVDQVKKQVAEKKKEEVALGVQTLTTQAEEYIRVPISRVNKLLNLTGEMVINKMKSSSKILQAKRLSLIAKTVLKTVSDLSEKVKKEMPTGNIEIAKLFSQCSADLQRLRDDAFNLYDNISNEAFHLDPVIDELQGKMKEIRMLPLSAIIEGFPRMVRDIASQENKEVNLEISGEETELDKRVLEGIKSPLMHILRNCIDHGIESADKRASLGKPRYGMIKVSAFHEAGNAIIVIEDDGKGMVIEEIKQTALKKDLVSDEDFEKMTEKEILNLIFMNGYSTSPIITDVSGRGIGLDVVRQDIEDLKGQVILDTEKDKGTKFTLILPLTIAIIQVLLIKQNNKLLAFPMASIAESLNITRKDISTIEGKMAIQIRKHTVPLVELSQILHLPSIEEDDFPDGQSQKREYIPVVVAISFNKQIGFMVDEIVGEEEIFIKSLGEHLGKVRNVSGATILGTGEVVVILDVADLVEHSRLSHPAVSGRKTIAREKRIKKRILVVEDAFSTRELEKSILEGQGYFVDTAVDGLDALDRLVGVKYDLIVSDIQMPRMDGFQFCKTIKQNEDYKDIPVVMVTALGKEEDKKRGIEVGASAYIVKTAFDQSNLIDTIERLIG